MQGVGITYFQATVKDMQMEDCCSNSIKMCLHAYLPKPQKKHGNKITPMLLHVQVRSWKNVPCAASNTIHLEMSF